MEAWGLAGGQKMKDLQKSVVRREEALVTAFLAGVTLLLAGAHGQAEGRNYDPDPQTCQVEMIRTTFRANLLPWADQPAAVQQRLRQLQSAMTVDTLLQCQARGLLTPSQVQALGRELGLPLPTGSDGAAPIPVQSPVRP